MVIVLFSITAQELELVLQELSAASLGVGLEMSGSNPTYDQHESWGHGRWAMIKICQRRMERCILNVRRMGINQKTMLRSDTCIANVGKRLPG